MRITLMLAAILWAVVYMMTKENDCLQYKSH